MRADRGARRGTPPGWPCPQASAAELLPGVRVGQGRFVVGALLGRGGMASVYRSRDRRLGRDVALKVMLVESACDAARVARFEHEAELVARLPSHPGLLRLLHAGRLPELGERPFLAATLVEGPTLAFCMASDLRMPARRSVTLALGLGRALAAVHGVGVVHRDLTARNVMLAHEGDGADPIVVDFGMAAVLEPVPGASRLTRPDQRPGTVTAMAPEQYLGRPAHPAMDVYALGRLLYEMLTAEDPHATVSPVRLMERHRQGARVAPRLAIRGDVGPPELRALVDACLEPDPARRPSTAAIVAALIGIERGLERGGTVLRLAARGRDGGARAGHEVQRRLAPQAPARGPSAVTVPRPPASVHEPSVRAGWRIAYLAVTLTGVALGSWVARSSAVHDEGPARPFVQPSEPAAMAWPTTVVPMIARSERSRVPDDPPVAGAPPRAAAAIRGPRRAPACAQQRERARAAARGWDWPRLLEATADRACWPDADERTRLRLTAWIEQRRFDACVEGGADVREPQLVRLVDRCRQRLAAAASHEHEEGVEGPP